ncbi:hypothetical protein GCM10010151_30250 [Actinoallomurus spadix]|uniref:EcsC family protein n=1 Tax=Actinoallomurus spadix TaxID=79912 RepID=A0ABP3G966_9ACTN
MKAMREERPGLPVGAGAYGANSGPEPVAVLMNDLSPFARVNADELNVDAGEAEESDVDADDTTTAVAKQLSPLDKLGSALTRQLMKVVDDGVGPVTGSRDYAEARLAQFGDPEKAIKRIIAETTAQSAVAGFVTGVGGLITLPVTLPANITGQAILNARMVGAIAHLRGWDLEDEIVRNSVLITIAGGTPNAVLAEFGVAVARKSAEAAIKKLPVTIIREINKRVGFMLVAKYGTKRSVVTLSKLVPGVGGVIGGAVDATFTRIVGRLARKSFPALAPTVDVAE